MKLKKAEKTWTRRPRWAVVVDGETIGYIQSVRTGGSGRGRDVIMHTGYIAEGAPGILCATREEAAKRVIRHCRS